MGFILYTAGFTISQSWSVNFAVCQGVQVVGVILILFSALSLIEKKVGSKYLSVLVVLYALWSLGIITRGLSFNYNTLKLLLFDAGGSGVFLYLSPIVILFPKSLKFYGRLFKVIVISCLIFIASNIIFRDIVFTEYILDVNKKYAFEHFAKFLSIPAGFILITFPYHKKKTKILMLVVALATIAIAILRARRAIIFITLMSLVFAYFLYLYYSKSSVFVILFSILVVVSAVIFRVDKVVTNSSFFSHLSQRALSDTRTGVEVCLQEDLTTWEWIIGKGLDGEYYCPGIDVRNTNGYRKIVETEYLNMILKGGIINLLLILLITIPAVIKGLFYSRNILAKGSALWILLWLISLYPANVQAFSLNYLLVWISVGICYTKSIRDLPDMILIPILRTGN